jgi:hypothetical protein
LNAFLGKLENNYKRLIGWWCNIPLPELLRAIAAYLERKEDTRYLHPGWLKSCKVFFNKLSESQKATVLGLMKQSEGKNGAERKDIFRKALLSKKYTYVQVLEFINSTKTKEGNS